MMLINSLLLHATETRWNEFMSEFERLNFNKAVVVCFFVFSLNVSACN